MCCPILVAILCALAGGESQATPRIPAELRGEGALQNDTRLPASDTAAAKLAEGDRAWMKSVALASGSASAAEAPEGAAAPETPAILEAMEAWQTALLESRSGDTVPGVVVSASDAAGSVRATLPDPDPSLARRVESVESAVERRLTTNGLRSRWSTTFASRARTALDRANGGEALLSRVVRDFPFTASAARACLTLCDKAFERGDAPLARRWLERAREQLATAEQNSGAPPEPASFTKREHGIAAFLARDPYRAQGPLAVESATDAWTRARALSPSRKIRLEDASTPSTPRRGVREGMIALDPGAVLVQSTERIYRASKRDATRVLDIEALQSAFGLSFGPAFAEQGGTWMLAPSAGSGRVVAVLGRARHEQGNACVALDAGLEGGVQSFVWAYSPSGFRTRARDTVPLADALGHGVWEFQPAPIVLGMRVFVEARQWDESDPERVDERSTKVWILALDLETGVVLWKRLLAEGAVLESDASVIRLAQIAGERGFAPAAEPMTLREGRLFVSTGLGSATLLDTSDGRIDWTLRTRRRTPAETGWQPMPAVPMPPEARLTQREAGPTSEGRWAWAPSDSDFVYLLRGGPDRDGRGILRRPPEAIGDSSALLGAGGDELLTLRGADGRRRLSRWNLSTGASIESVHLGREEEFRACAEPSSTRIVLCTDCGLYLFDKERDLYLLDFERLPPEEPFAERSMCVQGDEVWVLEGAEIQIFDVR